MNTMERNNAPTHRLFSFSFLFSHDSHRRPTDRKPTKPIAQIFTASSLTLLTTLLFPGQLSQAGQVGAIEEIKVISSTRREESLSGINASVSVLSEEELKLISHTHIQESLNRLAGVNISHNNGQESLTSIRSPILTGAGACGAFLMAEQGIPLRAAGFCNVNELIDANTENAQRIEVIRGPGSAFYGSNAVHGMVNVVLPEPKNTKSFKIETGPRGYYRMNSAIGFANGDFKQLFLFNGASEEGWRDDSGYDQQKFSWLYEYTTKSGYSLQGGLTHTNLNQETAGYVGGTDSYKDSSLRDTNPNPEAYRDNQSFRLWTRISKELESGWEVVLTPYYRNVDLNFIQHFLPGTPVEDNQHDSLGFQFASYKSLSDNTVLTLGLDMEVTEGSLLQAQDGATVGSAFLVATVPAGKHYDYDVDATQIAPFINLQHDWDNGWDMTLGLRYERMDYEYDNKMVDGRTREDGTTCGFGGCRYTRPGDRDDDFGDWSPKLALRYQLNDQHSVRARYSRGFRAPQATELYRLQRAQTVADLDSVEIDSLELAFEGFGEGWEYSIVAYQMDKDNEIFRDSDFFNVNNSETRHRGIELSGSLQLNDHWTVQSAFNVARHTYENHALSGGIDINGNDVDSAPRRFGNLQLQWSPNESFTSELEWVNMGEYYTNPENLNDYSGHDLLNLRMQYQIRSNVSLSLNILNLTDREYAERADFSGFTGDRYFPGEPARAFFSVNWNYD